MAAPVTAEFHDLVFEVEFDPVGSAGTYSIICGIVSKTVTREAQTDTTEVPADCTDEEPPLVNDEVVRSISVGVELEGVFSLQSHTKLLDWFYNGTKYKARIRHAIAEGADGGATDITLESGVAQIRSIPYSVAKGQKVRNTVNVVFNKAPTLTLKGA